MEKAFIENKDFEKIDFTTEPLALGEYENCHFKNCRFPGVNLSNIIFSDCRFTDCDISSANIINTAFRNITFKGCKMLGLHFNECNSLLFKADFEDCLLTLASFFQRKIKGAIFRNCTLHDADFAEADISQAAFDNCDLLRALFDGTNLEKADLRTAYHYSIDPAKNKIKKAKFSRSGLAGLLDGLDIVIE